MVVMPLIQTAENVESVTILMAVLGKGAGKQSVEIPPLLSISPLQNPIRNRRSPYRSRIRVGRLTNPLSGSSLLHISLLPTSSHLHSQLRSPLARQDTIRMLRVHIRRWESHLRTQ